MVAANYPGIGSIGFSTPQELIQLQAADLIAYETYRYLIAKAANEGVDEGIEPRPALKRFHESGRPMWIGYFDKESLHETISKVVPEWRVK